MVLVEPLCRSPINIRRMVAVVASMITANHQIQVSVTVEINHSGIFRPNCWQLGSILRRITLRTAPIDIGSCLKGSRLGGSRDWHGFGGSHELVRRKQVA